MHVIITWSALSICNYCNQQLTCTFDKAKKCVFPLVTVKEVKKASSSLNGYVVVFTIVGDQSSAHDQFEEVGVLKRAHDGNYGNVLPHVYQIHTSKESVYRDPTVQTPWSAQTQVRPSMTQRSP